MTQSISRFACATSIALALAFSTTSAKADQADKNLCEESPVACFLIGLAGAAIAAAVISGDGGSSTSYETDQADDTGNLQREAYQAELLNRHIESMK